MSFGLIICYVCSMSAILQKHRKIKKFFHFVESLSYRFLITFCRGPDHLKINQNASQNGASGHPKSQKNKKTEHSKKHQKNNTQKVSFRMQNDVILGPPGPPKWDQKSMKIKLRARTVAKRGLRAQIWRPGAAPERVSGQTLRILFKACCESSCKVTLLVICRGTGRAHRIGKVVYWQKFHC